MPFVGDAPISISQIRNAYKSTSGSADISDFYRGGPNVPDVSETQTIPTAGPISWSDFECTGPWDFSTFGGVNITGRSTGTASASITIFPDGSWQTNITRPPGDPGPTQQNGFWMTTATRGDLPSSDFEIRFDNFTVLNGNISVTGGAGNWQSLASGSKTVNVVDPSINSGGQVSTNFDITWRFAGTPCLVKQANCTVSAESGTPL